MKKINTPLKVGQEAHLRFGYSPDYKAGHPATISAIRRDRHCKTGIRVRIQLKGSKYENYMDANWFVEHPLNQLDDRVKMMETHKP